MRRTSRILASLVLTLLVGCGANNGTVNRRTETAHGELTQVAFDVESRDEDGLTPLHHAAIDGDVGLTTRLIKAGAQVDARSNVGNTPLHAAALHGHHGVAERLIQANADVNAFNQFGQSVLHLAVCGSSESVVRLLLDAGAEVNAVAYDAENPDDGGR